MWQVSRQTPSFGWESSASKYGPKSQVREQSEEPWPAVDSSSRNGSSSWVSSSSSGSMCSRTCASAVSRARPPVAEPVCTTTPERADLPAAAQECRSDSTDLSTVASVCEPKLIRYGAWTYAGIALGRAPVAEQLVLHRVPGAVSPSRADWPTKTWTVSAPSSRA